ncbi:MAG: M28 family peptidase [Thermoanaerobaculia bacterium]|nr:M28 family peptidase [Thermoanaerobaculia bacterium]
MYKGQDKIGSGHWMRNPLWPLSKTAVYLNFDMVAHPWKAEEIRDLVAAAKLPDAETFLAAARPETFIEPGVASFAPDLGPLLARAGSAADLALHLDWTEGVTGGSDYRDFARARVPFVRFFGNFHPDYHRPGDTPASIDPDQVRRVTRLGLATAWLAADR